MKKFLISLFTSVALGLAVFTTLPVQTHSAGSTIFPNVTDPNDKCEEPSEILDQMVTPKTSSYVERIKFFADPVEIDKIKGGIAKKFDQKKEDIVEFVRLEVFKNDIRPGFYFIVLYSQQGDKTCMIRTFWSDIKTHDEIMALAFGPAFNGISTPRKIN